MLGPWFGCVILGSVAWEAAGETSDELTGEGFGLKNPFRLLWPGADDVGVAKDFEQTCPSDVLAAKIDYRASRYAF